VTKVLEYGMTKKNAISKLKFHT